jgi:L-alanine-DL-glutamate epimerase-like enolase superfamily enzyme
VSEAAGDDVDLMFDAWSSWDVPYTLQMARQMVDYNPRWIEEPVLADKPESYARIRRASPVPIAGGEHEYTRWGFKALLDIGAVDVLQPDVTWAGGLSEAVKICTLASAYDVPVVCHHGVPQTVHLAASQPPTLYPMMEYLIKYGEVLQFFLKEPQRPVDGFFSLPKQPGLGLDFDDGKVRNQRDLTW